jgi:hypothetical protein
VDRWPSPRDLLDLALPIGGTGLQGASFSPPPGSSGLPWNQPSWPSLLLRGQRAGGLPFRMAVCGLLAGRGHRMGLTSTDVRCFRSELPLLGLPKYRAPDRAQRHGACVSPPSTSAIRVRSDSVPDFRQRTFIRPARCERFHLSVDRRTASARCRAGACQTTCAFRPCRSSRLRRLAPRITLRACCIPQPTLGFVPFPDSDSRPEAGQGDQPCRSRCFCQRSFPWDARPFEAFPLHAAIRAVRWRPKSPPHRPLTPASPTTLLPWKNSIARALQSAHPGRSRPGFPSRRCSLASAPPPLPAPSALIGVIFRDAFECLW